MNLRDTCMYFLLQIVHCDLAARNILIAEGFLLKIGDFGMARCMASDYDSRYQRVQSIVSCMQQSICEYSLFFPPYSFFFCCMHAV